jgi:chemotaxis protein methyltransferase CheR
MNGQDLDTIADYVNRRSRLFFHGHRMSLLRSRVEQRLSSLVVHDCKEYYRHLRESPEEEATLFDLLTTNETSFFRNQKQFSYLTTTIIPRIEEERRVNSIRSWGKTEKSLSASLMKMRILCAGCSTGEEPYSVGMALLESLRYPRAWDIEILAGDLSGSCITTALAGYYSKERLVGIPPEYRDKYLVKTGTGAFIAGEVKSLVKFRVFNLNDLMDPAGMRGVHESLELFDIIFCRNVMIYFSAESQQHLVDVLHRHLVPGGYLFTGDAEPLHLYRHEFSRVQEADCLIYRKAWDPATTGFLPSADPGLSCTGQGFIDG